MSSGNKGWMVAASIGVVEALKDQGFCRWNSAMRSLQQYDNSHFRAFYQAHKLSSPSSAVVSSKADAKHSEESLRTVMYLSCWGPNS